MTAPGDRCPNCGNRLSVYCSRERDGITTRYLACRRYGSGRKSGCGYRPPDNVVILVHASTKIECASTDTLDSIQPGDRIHQTEHTTTTQNGATAMTPNMLSIAQVAGRLQLHPNTIARRVRDGTLPSSRIGGAVRIPRVAIEELERGEQADTEDQPDE